ncbi:hypothetical protein SCA03_66860 [Streptomyces cacaoi]|uniref:Uncharacterized protein n=1 Tax=Streptomyces cacaoi TaxID=1898 RepID=A0A4Y3R8R6_STRCI|nr:hypothetical protein SCA03_66860 [Streptomyces cacaoi]
MSDSRLRAALTRTGPVTVAGPRRIRTGFLASAVSIELLCPCSLPHPAREGTPRPDRGSSLAGPPGQSGSAGGRKRIEGRSPGEAGVTTARTP